MRIIATPLADLNIVKSAVHRDARGAFTRLFCDRELDGLLGDRRIVQINHSITRQPGTVRGMHFQRPPYAEIKMIRCLRGRVWDVAVDLRADSRTFLQWHAQELAHEDAQMLVIPEGFAHGFQALEPDSELLYLHTAPYHQPSEGGIRPDDPRLDISWPLPQTGLSTRDLGHPALNDDFPGVVL